MKNYLKEISLDVENWEEIAENRTEWQRNLAERWGTSEVKNFVHAEFKRGPRKGVVKGLEANIVSWKSEM